MRLHLIPRALILLVLLALAGCQALPGVKRGGDAAVAQSPVTGGEIVVTSLDSAPLPAAAEAEAVPLSPVPDSMPDAPVATADAANAPIAEPVGPVAVKSAAHLACEKRGGIWSAAGGGTAAFCQTPTRDAGKSCKAATDCTGYCLSQSGTCAPVTPMLGCHAILDEQGRMLTQCIN
ncbi:MAG: hypothetical protein Q7J44_04860 [Pseudotabrizicola sp.]|uniref:hypothetical protein n=1 Tax=Pseudotabrizicola sp. TaxID=2939647 RepID=UPI002722D996|nr:hypothetical protein [Pseudotabrizicola sp.]MDO9637853.1 hypothetical protein [Pseudotabrizicola sp.]